MQKNEGDMMNTLKTHELQEFSQFDLTKYLLNNLKQFNITPTAKLVLLQLSDCYNPKKPDMFPKQKTIALKLGISERSVNRAVQELFKAGLILIECKYTNKYKFTSKIASKCPLNKKTDKQDNLLFKVRKNGVKEYAKLAHHDTEQKKVTKKTTNNAAVLYSNSAFKRTVSLNDIPGIIRDNPKIKNPCAYWAALTEEVKNQYLEKDTEEKQKEAKRQALQLKKQQEELEKQRQRKLDSIERNKPLNERFTRNQAIKHVWALRNIVTRLQKQGLTCDLINLYNLDVKSICTMEEKEIAKLQ